MSGSATGSTGDGQADRWIATHIPPGTGPAVAVAIADCGGRILDSALDRALLFEAAPDALERLRLSMPQLNLIREARLQHPSHYD